MDISVHCLPPGNQWDQTVVSELLADRLYHHGLTFRRHDTWPDSDGLVLIIPGRYWYHRTDELTDALVRYQWVLAIRTGDEEDLLDVSEVVHPNLRWWVQTPRVDRDYGDARLFGVGYAPVFANLPAEPPPPRHNAFLSAQKNHDRRHDFFDHLDDLGPNCLVTATDGFTHGMTPHDYADVLTASRAALAPSGPYTPDTFRAYEALQSHTVPIVDDVATYNPTPGYWRRLFPDAPFPIVTNLNDLTGYTHDTLDDYPHRHNRVAAWWMRQKHALTGWLRDDLSALGVILPDPEPITVVVPTSPIPSHPDAGILDETLASIRHHFPTATILLTFDGVRPEQEHRRADYEEYIRRALWRADHRWGNIIPTIFDTHHHQSEMLRAVLPSITTPLILYVEHDAPLVLDCPIDWPTIQNLVTDGTYHLVRLYHEAVVPDEHRYLMGEPEGDFLPTSQWSQRPHLTTTAFYRRVLAGLETGTGVFIEEPMHSIVSSAWLDDGLPGWQQWRLAIYAPQDGMTNYKRSYHTDGRAGEDNYL